jgi:hypothetical protein
MLLTLSQHKPIVVEKWMQNVTQSSEEIGQHFMHDVFSVSYMYYSFIGTMITVVVGMIVSLLTMSKNDAYDSKYIHPLVYKITKLIPGYDRLFSNEQLLTSQIKTSTLKEQSTPSSSETSSHGEFNHAFDIKSEQTEDIKFKSNIISIKTDLSLQPEKYKKLEEV